MKKINFILLLLTFYFLPFTLTAQQGGMWIPSLLEGMNAKEMKSLGMKMSVSDIYSINKSSLKDAVPHFNGGCTAEIISNQGLLLTNHHCGYGQIQAHSSVQNDYLTDGFWAKNLSEELPNKNLVVTFIVRIEDVTKKVLADTQNLSDETLREAQIQRNIASLVKNSPKESWQENRIRAFYEGNQYILFVVETFKDVRLVGAPPSSIGKFGSDTDNWVWPRHTGDFSLFRVYADKNNRPAEYSKDNVPYRPKHFFPISLKGVKAGDFTMVFGYPGRTEEYLPAVAVEQIVNVLNPAKIGIRDVILKTQDGFMRANNEIKIKYASKYASVANYWKKWIGETQGLKKSNAVAIKRAQEQKFIKEVEKRGKTAEYGHILPQFAEKYAKIQDYALATDLYWELAQRNIDLIANGYKILQLRNALREKGSQSFADRKKNLLNNFETVFKNYDINVDKAVFEQAINYYAKTMPKALLSPNLHQFDAHALADKLYKESFLASKAEMDKVLNLPDDAFEKRLKNDVGVQFVDQIIAHFYETVMPTYQNLGSEIAALQRTYMKAILEFSKPQDRIFPDANSTLRVTYGKVTGYSPSDAVTYDYITYLDGVMEKYVPNDYEFDVPAKLRELYEKKDYGIYSVNGKMPVCFIATNHTTGGNSGSPAIDAQGNLIGLNFDRVWEGTMSDIHYDPKICRNIMVDIRYVLFIIDKYAGAGYLLNEMKLVK
ncbi:S46 family peptidase [Capnocytophaga sputigena]|jgi:dipeptidyl-peptidase 7. serine peptidase. merops family s46|uniref:S46 family peptidase n=1 Tax=Capnocytophaga sputigena TaxID=1019 RepID=UPI000BB1B6D1|nr:S46 family peptidase [Capnocytophaga sputigena]ATA71411.1 serine protease [Capnocytophaga sputigena]VEI56241.1 Peptidase S46 [Capnocytophaga sputigena]